MQIIEPSYKWAYALTTRSITTHLILHHAAGEGSAETIHKYHLSLGWAGIAYHYYVRRDGSVYRGRPEAKQGGHTTNWNWCAIGICFEGNFENEKMSDAQKKAGAALVADIVSRYPTITIGKHSEFGATSCPGKNFPYKEIASGASPEPARDVEDTGKADSWARSACDWAAKTGLFKGDEKGNFHWKDTVTRQELAVVMQRGFQLTIDN